MKRSAIILLAIFVIHSYAHPRPQETPMSNIDVKGSSVDASEGENVASNDVPIYTKQGYIQRNPTYYTDMFNIPIATLQAVSNFLSGGNTNITGTKQYSMSKDDQLLSFLKSAPLSESPVDIPNHATLIASSNVAPAEAIPDSNNNQITKQGIVVLRIPSIQDIYNHPKPQETPLSNSGVNSVDTTVGANVASNDNPLYTKQEFIQRNPTYYQDMLNIPIATLQAVSNFLSGTNPNTSVNKQSSISKDDQSSPLLKSSPLSELPVEIPNDSTLIASSNVGTPVEAIPESINNQLTKQGIIILRIPTIQDIFNIPISTLQAVSHFLTTAYASQPPNAPNPGINAVDQSSSLVAPQSQIPVEKPKSANYLDKVTALKSIQAVDDSVKIIKESELKKEKSSMEIATQAR